MKTRAIALTLVLFIVAGSLTAQNMSDEAAKALKKKDYAAAFKIAKEGLSKDSASAALRIFIQLREKNYDDKNLFEYLGDCYGKLGVGESALTNYEQAEKLDSLNVVLKMKSAELLRKQKRYTEAVNKYLKVVALDPKNQKAFLEAASMLYQAKMYGDAAVLFEKYIVLDKSKDAYQKITTAFIVIKNYEKAYKYGVEGLAKFPKDAVLSKNSAIASFGLQKFDESSQFYGAVPDSQMSVIDLKNAGKAFQMVKADSMAIKYYEKVVKKDSTQSGLFMDMANNYFRNKQNDLAVKFYLAKIKSDTTYEPAYRYMGFALIGLEKYNDARGAFIKARNLVDTTFETNYWLAECYTKIDSAAMAASQFEKVLKLSDGKEKQYKDKMLEAADYLARRAYDRKNWDVVIKYTSKALQLKPSEWRYMEMLGVCYNQLGNNDEAIKWYRATLKANPKNETAKKGLRRLSAD